MKQSRLGLSLALLAALTPAAVHAQAARTFVSGVGDDANPCSRTAPCKTFPGALQKTAAGGEINVLDSAGFGAVTINKSITINGGGVHAGILNSLLSGIIINAGAEDRVVLRNLSIHGGGSGPTANGLNGIRLLSARHLTVENVVISGFSNAGIDVSIGTGAGIPVGIDLSNVRITRGVNLGGSGTGRPVGILVTSLSAQGVPFVTLDHVTLAGLENGLEAAINARVTVRDSVISGNRRHGILASQPSAVINVESSQIAFNGLVGVNASVAGSTIRLSNNDIYNNSTGISFAPGATVESAGNNRVAGNTTTTAPNATIPVQ